MRRILVLVGVLLAALLVWWAFGDDDPGATRRSGAADDPAAAESAAEAARAKKARDRAKAGPAESEAETVAGFLGQWPEIGQDREQDPTLGAFRGRVLVTPGEAPAESVVEATVKGVPVARVRLRGTSQFLLRNVPPGSGLGITARAEGHAPGGLEALVATAGKVTDVGTIYVGMAIDPDVDNRVEVVVTSRGKPVPDAQVTVTTVFYGSLVSLGSLEKQPGGTIFRGTTGPEGRALFTMLPPAQYDVFAEKDGYSFEVEPRQVIQRATKAVIELDMDPGLTISGRVQTPDGAPVADARVGILRWGSFTNVPSCTSDSEGKFVAKGLSAGNYFLVFARDDLGSKDLQNIAAGTKDLVVTIEDGAVLWVKCTDAATGAPVKDFGVRPYRKVPFAYLFAPLLEARTEDGVLRTKLLAASDYGAEVSAQGYALANVATLQLSPAAPVEVKLEPAGVVRGRVVAKGTGRPIRGAQVFVKRGGFPPARVKDQQTVSDAQGLFTLDGLALRPINFVISHVDHDEASFEGVDPVARGSGGSLPAPRDFELGSGGRIEGRVVGADAKPEAGATVQLLVGFDVLNARRAVTDADGRYAFENVPVQPKYTVVVGSFGPGRSGRNRTDVVVTEGQTVVVDFVPEAGGSRVTGRTVRDGKPAEGVNVSLVADDGGQFTGSERTKADGTFAFENVPAGRFVVRAPGAATQTVTVTADAPVPELSFVLSTAYIAGKVVDATTGQVLPGTWVDCEQTGDVGGAALPELVRRNRGNGPVTPEGTFTFRGLEDGTYLVRAVRDGYGSEIADGIVVRGGEARDGVVLRLGPACTVSGTVKNSSGAPVEGAALVVRDSQGRRMFAIALTQSNGDGTWSQGALRPDTYDLTFEKDGYAPCTQRVTLATSAAARADFVLLQGGRFEVVVTKADGSPVKDAVVSLFDAAGQPVTRGLTLSNLFSTNRTRTDANGQVVLTGVAPGVYRVTALAPGGTAPSERTGAEATEGATTRVEIVLPSGE